MAEKKVDDRFKKFGTVSFTSISKINDFVDYLEQRQGHGNKVQKLRSDLLSTASRLL